MNDCDPHPVKFIWDGLFVQNFVEAHERHGILVGHLADDDGVEYSHTLSEEKLGSFVGMDDGVLVNFHALGESRGVRERQDI